MNQNLQIVFNEPITDAQLEQLTNAIVAWLDSNALTALITAGDESEEDTHVQTE
jgi:hypothetical protein